MLTAVPTRDRELIVGYRDDGYHGFGHAQTATGVLWHATRHTAHGPGEVNRNLKESGCSHLLNCFRTVGGPRGVLGDDAELNVGAYAKESGLVGSCGRRC
jgi:hypothetical protein